MNTDIIEHQKISTIVVNYETAQKEIKEAFELLVSAKKRLYATLGQYHDSIFNDRISDYSLADSAKKSEKTVRQNAWRYIISQLQIESMMSSAAKQKLDKQIEEDNLPELTVENAYSVLQGFAQNAPSLLEDAIKEVFDWLRPRWGHYKTNKKFYVGQKVIISYAVESWLGMSLNYREEQHFRALDNVFHLLDGKGSPKYPGNLVTGLKTAMQEKKAEYEDRYFSCKWQTKLWRLWGSYEKLPKV